MTPIKFTITGFPRSRTAWFAGYFTNGPVICYHEAYFNHEDMDSEGYTHIGNSDSGHLFNKEDTSDHRMVVVHRDIEQVRKSMLNLWKEDSGWLLQSMGRALDNIKGLHIDFPDIDKRMEEIHKYLDIPYNKERHALFTTLNIQAQNLENL